MIDLQKPLRRLYLLKTGSHIQAIIDDLCAGENIIASEFPPYRCHFQSGTAYKHLPAFCRNAYIPRMRVYRLPLPSFRLPILQLPAYGLRPKPEEIAVYPWLYCKLLMRSPLSDSSAVYDQYLIGIPHRRQPVRNGKSASFPRVSSRMAASSACSFSGSTLEVGLVENDDWRIL